MSKMFEKKLHYKMYKAGKHWVFAAITVGIFGFASTTSALADETSGSNKILILQQMFLMKRKQLKRNLLHKMQMRLLMKRKQLKRNLLHKIQMWLLVKKKQLMSKKK